MTYKKGTSDVFLKFVAQADKLKQIKKICDTMLQQLFKEGNPNTMPYSATKALAFIKGFKMISDIVEEKNENK